ncbi:hypothetical protein HN587_01210 [Candidatus Woesearchaeota archaeon]|jgi:hypothetical protein|nr:hypothetical protein [Candidatus Woesearchaeota archaeon]
MEDLVFLLFWTFAGLTTIFFLDYLLEVSLILFSMRKVDINRRDILEETAKIALKKQKTKVAKDKFRQIKKINKHIKNPAKNMFLIEIHSALKIIYNEFNKKHNLQVKLEELYPRLSEITVKRNSLVYLWNLSPNDQEKIIKGRVGKIMITNDSIRTSKIRTRTALFIASNWFAHYLFTSKNQHFTIKKYNVIQEHNLCRIILAYCGLIELAHIKTPNFSLVPKHKSIKIPHSWVLAFSDFEISRINHKLGHNKKHSKNFEQSIRIEHEINNMLYLREVLKKEIHIVETEEKREKHSTTHAHIHLRDDLKKLEKELRQIKHDEHIHLNHEKFDNRLEKIIKLRIEISKKLAYFEDILIRGSFAKTI